MKPTFEARTKNNIQTQIFNESSVRRSVGATGALVVIVSMLNSSKNELQRAPALTSLLQPVPTGAFDS